MGLPEAAILLPRGGGRRYAMGALSAACQADAAAPGGTPWRLRMAAAPSAAGTQAGRLNLFVPGGFEPTMSTIVARFAQNR